MQRLTLVLFMYLKLIFGDRLFTAAMIIFPILLGLIYGYAAKHEDDTIIRAAYVDYDNTGLSGELFERLKKHEGLEISKVTMDEGKRLLENGKTEAVFVLEKGFEESINKSEIKPSFSVLTLPSSFSGGLLTEILASDISLINSKSMSINLINKKYKEMGLNTQGLNEKAEKYYSDLTGSNPLLKVNYEVLGTRNNTSASQLTVNPQRYMSYGGLLMFIMFFLMFGSGWIIESRENGTLKRLMSMKNGFFISFTGSFLCLMIAGTFQSAIFLFAGLALNTLVIKGLFQLAVLLVFIFSAASISMFMASIFKTSMQLQAFTPVFVLLISLAGGCFWDISLLSGRFEKLSFFTPQGLTLKALYGATLGTDWIQYPVILLLISTTILILSYFISSQAKRV